MMCKKCKIDKPEEDFPYKNKSLNKRSCVCKKCQKEYKRKYYYLHKQSHYDRNKKTEERIKKFILFYKENHPCIICGEICTACLDFHHLGDKSDNISNLYRKGSISKVIDEINKCVVLCANCHRKLHAGIISLET